MPYARKRKSGGVRTTRTVTTRRISKPKRSKATNARTTVAVQRGFLSADVQIVKLRYSANYTFTTDNDGIYRTTTFRGNSLFDPDYTGAGHQPRGFDQWAQLYKRYTVTGSSIALEASTVDPARPFTCFIVPYNEPQTFTGGDNAFSTYKEIKYCKAVISRNTGSTRISNYMSTQKIEGITKAKVTSEDGYSANTNANPPEQWYWTLGAQDISPGTARDIIMQITLVYYVRFYARVVPNSS